MGTNDRKAALERKDVLNNRLALPHNCDGIGNLNDGILLGLGKVSFAALAFNVKGKDAKRSNPVPFAFGLTGNNIIVRNVNLDLC